MVGIGLLGDDLSCVDIYVFQSWFEVITLFIVHLLDQLISYVVLSINSLSLSGDDLSSVYIYVCSELV
jgi:hypothetical protein